MDESFVRSSDGQRLRVLHSRFSDLKPAVTVVLPFGLRAEAASTFCSTLESEFNVLTWQGRSLSDNLPRTEQECALTPPMHVGDMRCVVESFGVSRSDVIGFCSGAGIALLAAAQLGHLFDRLVLVCGEYVLSPQSCRQSSFQREVSSLLPLAAQSCNHAQVLCEKLACSRGRNPDRSEFDAEVMVPFSSAVRLHRHGVNYVAYRRVDFKAVANVVPHRTRLISTAGDQQVSPESSKLIADCLPNAERHIVVPGDHYDILRAGTPVNDAIMDFLTTGGRAFARAGGAAA